MKKKRLVCMTNFEYITRHNKLGEERRYVSLGCKKLKCFDDKQLMCVREIAPELELLHHKQCLDSRPFRILYQSDFLETACTACFNKPAKVNGKYQMKVVR